MCQPILVSVLASAGGVELGVLLVEAPGVHGAEFVDPVSLCSGSNEDAAFGQRWCADEFDHTDGAVGETIVARRGEVVGEREAFVLLLHFLPVHAETLLDAVVGLTHVLESTHCAGDYIDEVGAAAGDVVHGRAGLEGVFALEVPGGVETGADLAGLGPEAWAFAFAFGAGSPIRGGL